MFLSYVFETPMHCRVANVEWGAHPWTTTNECMSWFEFVGIASSACSKTLAAMAHSSMPQVLLKQMVWISVVCVIFVLGTRQKKKIWQDCCKTSGKDASWLTTTSSPSGSQRHTAVLSYCNHEKACGELVCFGCNDVGQCSFSPVFRHKQLQKSLVEYFNNKPVMVVFHNGGAHMVMLHIWPGHMHLLIEEPVFHLPCPSVSRDASMIKL